MVEATGHAPFSLEAHGRSRRRLRQNRIAEVAATIAAGGAVAVLGWVILSVLIKGLPALNIDFFTKNAATFGQTGGGIQNALVGTPIIVGIATFIALPAGVLIAIFTAEFAPREVGRAIRLALDVLNGVPSVVIGVFVYVLLVAGGGGYSGYKAGFALAIIMLPLVSRSTMEVLDLVPNALREASVGLGVAKWRTVVSVIMPTVVGGILTGATLAVARAAGETAPLIFTTSVYATNTTSTDPSHALATIPFTIFTYSEAPDKSLNDQAWAAAFVLMAFVLVTSLTARYLLSRSQRKLKSR